MTILHPCHNCHRKPDCDIRKKTLAGLKGLGITKANLKCQIPQSDFPAGAVVDVTSFQLVPGGYADDGYRTAPTVRRGIVCRWHQGKAIVALNKDQEIEKPEEGAIGFLKVASEKLKATDLPPVEVCGCGLATERCENADYPSVRGGQYECRENAGNYGSDGSGGW